jgi:hypothetical protein
MPSRSASAASLSLEFARLIIERDPAARALPSFPPETFALDEAVRALTGHLCNKPAVCR